jgi:hypothetical protein
MVSLLDEAIRKDFSAPSISPISSHLNHHVKQFEEADRLALKASFQLRALLPLQRPIQTIEPRVGRNLYERRISGDFDSGKGGSKINAYPAGLSRWIDTLSAV